ncbi:hypothetical protein ABID12_001220 [Martelella mangrovi]|uniref:Uncharacterized protein n=1 Tax=Martelella mangrovi TaxID=1397477 RepID=A0ABV2I9I1_9HYPH
MDARVKPEHDACEAAGFDVNLYGFDCVSNSAGR